MNIPSMWQTGSAMVAKLQPSAADTDRAERKSQMHRSALCRFVVVSILGCAHYAGVPCAVTSSSASSRKAQNGAERSR